MEARTRENGLMKRYLPTNNFILEGTRTNILFLKKENYPPALSCGILPGVMRSVVAGVQNILCYLKKNNYAQRN